MGKTQSLPPFSGMLLVNKPKGITSHDLVFKMRKYLGTKAVGHAGTLDPEAEGLMMVLVGQATKLSQWVTAESKAYDGVITLGQETATADIEGEVTAEFAKKEASLQEVEAASQSLLGEHELSVPKYSAIKVEGQKLYERARAGLEVKCPKRKMTFYSAHIHEVQGPDIEFSLECSKGTYIRSWTVEMGRRLDSGAYLAHLIRTRVGEFYLEDSESLSFFESVKDLDHQAKLDLVLNSKCYVPLADSLPDSELVRLNAKEELLFSNGQIPNAVRARLIPLSRKAFQREKGFLVRMLGAESRLAGVLDIDQKGKLKIQRVFNKSL